MRIGWSTGYLESYWGNWHTAKQIGGSERIVVYNAIAQAKAGHEVTVRLPYKTDRDVSKWGVRWISQDAPSQDFDRLYCADDFDRRDRAHRSALVACRSDPPPHTDFDSLIFLSQHHARLMGHPGSSSVGGGVDLSEYATQLPRLPRRVICTSSPDRCPMAGVIGGAFDFRHAYKPVPGFQTTEYERDDLIALQKQAKALIYPLDPRRPSDFFSMAVLEAMAAGTPCVISDADSMSELWADAATILPRPIDLSSWYESVDDLLANPARWRAMSYAGRALAAQYDWNVTAQRYLSLLA